VSRERARPRRRVLFEKNCFGKAPKQAREALTPRRLRDDFHAFGRGALYIEIAQSFCHRTEIAVADYVLINFGDAAYFDPGSA
jgi:hypothetical protein